MMRAFLLVLSCMWTTVVVGQYYIFGGYNFGALELQGTNNVIAEFNTVENHSVALLQDNFHGWVSNPLPSNISR